MASTPTTAGDKSEAILDAALRLFGTLGFHGTAVPQIARAAGVGAGTIYRYFESKEQLVNVVYRRWKERLGEHLLEGFPFESPPRDQLQAYWTRQASFARENPAAFQFLELHHHADYLDAESLALETRLLGMALDFLVRWQTQGVVKGAPVEVLMALVHGAFVGLFKGWRMGGYALTDEVVARAEQCVWEAIRR